MPEIENWRGLRFTDIGYGEFELTNYTCRSFTVKIITPPTEGKPTISMPRQRLSDTEFVITEKKFNEQLKLGNIIIKDQNYAMGNRF